MQYCTDISRSVAVFAKITMRETAKFPESAECKYGNFFGKYPGAPKSLQIHSGC